MHLSQLNLTHGAKNKWEFVAQKERCLSEFVMSVLKEGRQSVLGKI